MHQAAAGPAIEIDKVDEENNKQPEPERESMVRRNKAQVLENQKSFMADLRRHQNDAGQ